MSRRRRRVLAGSCVLVLLASLAVTPVAGEAPVVTVAVDGESVTDGSATLVQSDPTVTVAVEAPSPIEHVDVRVGGVIRWSREPGESSVEATVPLELESGTNEVTVVTDAAGVSSVSVTVIKDTERPRVAYTTPFETRTLAGAPAEVRVDAAEVTLAGKLVDAAGVTRVTVDQAYTYDRADTTQVHRRHHAQREPGRAFEQPLLLGDGRNNVTAQYTDRLGLVRADTFVIVVDDTTAPTIDVSAPEQTSAGTVRLTGTVRDGVKVADLRVTRPDGTERVLARTDAEPDPTRLAVDLDESVELRDGTNEVVVTARDPAGNTATETITVERVGDGDPRVNVTARPVDGAADTVRVVGTVSGGPVTRVTLESVDEATGNRLDVARAHGAASVTRVAVNESLAAANASTTIRVLVTDDDGTQHETMVTAGNETAVTNATAGGDTARDDSQAADRSVESTAPAATASPANGSASTTASGEPHVAGESNDRGATTTQDESIPDALRRMARETVVVVRERVLTAVDIVAGFSLFGR